MNKLKIMYDDRPNDVIDRVNTALASQGIVFKISDHDLEGVASYALFIKGVWTDVPNDDSIEDDE